MLAEFWNEFGHDVTCEMFWEPGRYRTLDEDFFNPWTGDYGLGVLGINASRVGGNYYREISDIIHDYTEVIRRYSLKFTHLLSKAHDQGGKKGGLSPQTSEWPK